ncbi:MAG TPA: PQQ-dependent sugar dehydrogenase [Spongiibacteraceae bacterium]
MFKLPRLFILFVCLSYLISCGGGGGGHSSSTPTAPFGLTAPPPTAALNFPSGGVIGSVQLHSVASGFSAPVLFLPIAANYAVVEQGGTIRMLDANFTAIGTLLDISARVLFSGEQGLLGLAFDPNFANNGYFYVDYVSTKTADRCTTASDAQCTRISRFQLNQVGGQFVFTPVNSANEEVLLEISQPFPNHKGGMLVFGPDNYLYIGLGDGGSGGDPFGNAQNRASLLGKILRIDTSVAANSGGTPYTIPANNPFVGDSSARAEIWAYGLRNPWRFSFDRQTGALWAGDVGQNLFEEIDIITRGGNYGWNAREGKHAYNGGALPTGAIDPVWEYDHTQGQSITGGYVYRGNAMPAMRGQYIYGDFGSGAIWALDSGNFTNQLLLNSATSPSAFGEDANGEIYIVDYNGAILRIDSSSNSGTMPTKLSATGLFSSLTPLQAVPGLIEYEVNVPLWSDGATKRRWLALPNGGKITFSADTAWQLPIGSVVVKHFAIALDQRQPTQLHNLETRVLIHESSGWAGYTYRWNAQQTNADLITGGATATLQFIDSNGVAFTRDYDYPSSAQCHGCHTDVAGFLLGVRTRQLNRNFNYGSVIDNQLRSFNHVALFATDIGNASNYGAAVALDNNAASIAQRARDYLDANCAQCHQSGGPTGVALDLRADTNDSAMHALDIAPSAGDLGIANAMLIARGDKARSILWQRLRAADVASGRMPPLASHAIDEAAVAVVGQWIDSL